MNMHSNAMAESLGARIDAPARISPAQRIYWSVARELWENRWIYLVPLGVAALSLLGFFVSIAHLPSQIRDLPTLDAAQQRTILSQPYDLAAGLMMALAILISVFYCADALHGERRDRSILFWKSMPVSDTTTVLAKATIPIVIVPLLATAIAIAMQWIMLLGSSALLLMSGISPAPLWTQLSPLQMWAFLLYHILTAHALWPAPVYCWLLLVSGWARRAILLWAAVPVLVIGGLEKLMFHTSNFLTMVGSRLIGNTATAAMMPANGFPTDPMTHVTIGRFLVSPGLWLGLLISAAFLSAAIRLRRSRGAI